MWKKKNVFRKSSLLDCISDLFPDGECLQQQHVRLHLLSDLIFVTNGSITRGPTHLLLLVWFKKSKEQKWDVWHFSDSQVKELFTEPFFCWEPPHVLISPYIQFMLDSDWNQPAFLLSEYIISDKRRWHSLICDDQHKA